MQKYSAYAQERSCIFSIEKKELSGLQENQLLRTMAKN